MPLRNIMRNETKGDETNKTPKQEESNIQQYLKEIRGNEQKKNQGHDKVMTEDEITETINNNSNTVVNKLPIGTNTQESLLETQMNELSTSTTTNDLDPIMKKKKWKEPKRKKKTQNNNHINSINENSTKEKEIDKNIYGFQYKVTKVIDNSIRGNSFQPKAPKTVRFLFQNINSLIPNNDEKSKSVIDRIRDLQCDAIGLCETCTNWAKDSITNKWNRILFKRLPHSTMNPAKTKQKYTDNNYLPGGTVSITKGNWTNYIEHEVNDFRMMGRWTGYSYRMSPGKTAYRVCKSKSQEETSQSTYSQQYMMLKNDNFEDPDPRQQFIDDFITQFQKISVNQDNYFVLAMDGNEPVQGANKSGVTKLIDMYSTLHEDYNEFATHENGSQRIDYILCSRNILPFITRCGYIKFNEALDTDHRSVYFDFKEDIITNKITVSTTQVRMVGSNSTNYEGTNYIKQLHEYFSYHRIYEKVDEIYNRIKNKKNDLEIESITTELNKLDEKITEFMLSAEKKTCKKKSEALWSPKLHRSHLLISYINVMIKSRRQGIDSSTRLNQIKARMDESTAEKIAGMKLRLKKELKKALSDHMVLLIDHYKLREEYLETLVSDINNRIDTKQVVTIKAIMHRERSRNDHRCVRRVFKGNKGKGITSLEVPLKDGSGRYITLTELQEIEKELLLRNIEHFGQANDTPFGSSPLLDILEYEGINNAVQNMIQNKHIPQELDNQPEYVKKILEKLSDGENLPVIDKDNIYEEFCEGFKKWKKRTTTSPSGRHLGHYKILLKIGVEDDNNKTINVSSKIMDVYYKIFMSVAEIRTTLKRWCSISTCMIEKIKNCPRIDKLRVIHLFEADYNLLLKIVWARKLVWNSNDNNRLHQGQAGSRPGRKAIDVVIQKELKYLYARLTKTVLGTIDNDAKSCYDRIMCNLSMCVSQYYGVPINMSMVQAKTLQNSIFRLRTAIGDSINTYKNTKDTPIHGTGQGSCASPALWLIISSMLMDILQKNANGMTIVDLNNKEIVKQWIEGFVDDTSLFSNIEFVSQCVKTMVSTLQNDGIEWAGLLAASGGKLELQKCFYYILSWSWNEKGEAIPQTLQQQANTEPINLDPKSTTINHLEQREISSSHRTLGAFKCIDGNEEDHKKFLYKKSEDMGHLALNGQLNKRQARLAYRSVYIPSMIYTLPAMSLNEEETNYIQQPAIQRFIRVIGFEKSFPRAAVYASIKYGGLGLPHLYAYSSSCKVECVLGNINMDTELGKLIIVDLDWIQMNTWLSTPILEYGFVISYLPRNWITSIQEYLMKINAIIEIQDLWIPIIRRIHNKIIMDEIESIDSNTNDKCVFNYWRIYFKVTTISNIVNNKGTHIKKKYLDKTLLRSWKPDSNILWPNQQMPNEKYFNIWIKGLESIIKFDRRTGELYKKLGVWVVDSSIEGDSEFMIHKNGQILAIKNNTSGKWHQH
jgi:Reverse transcriptase (RNA-dependent DNA polymerase)